MNEIVVERKAGRLRGSTERGVHVFKGIAYAARPAGRTALPATGKPAAWNGVREALAYGNRAI